MPLPTSFVTTITVAGELTVVAGDVIAGLESVEVVLPPPAELLILEDPDMLAMLSELARLTDSDVLSVGELIAIGEYWLLETVDPVELGKDPETVEGSKTANELEEGKTDEHFFFSALARQAAAKTTKEVIVERIFKC